MYLVGWKDLLAFAQRKLNHPRLSIRTLKRWHYERLKIPFAKSVPNRQGRVSTTPAVLTLWLDIIGPLANKPREPKIYRIPTRKDEVWKK